MKPFYWKLLLILGAVIVGASLIIPKSLRKNTNISYETSARSELVAKPSQDRARVGKTGVGFSFNKVVHAAQGVLELCVAKDQCPLGAIAVPHKDGSGYIMLEANNTLHNTDNTLHNTDIKEAFASAHPRDASLVVNFTLKPGGNKRLCEFTSKHIGKAFAIVFNGEVLSHPTIKTAICGGGFFIQNNFTMKEAKDIALKLNAGTRPTKSRVIDLTV